VDGSARGGKLSFDEASLRCVPADSITAFRQATARVRRLTGSGSEPTTLIPLGKRDAPI